MRFFSVLLLAISAQLVSAKDSHISFSSRRQIGKLPKEVQAVETLVLATV